MMFVFTILLMLAFGAVLYLMVRTLPRITEEPQEKESLLDRWERSQDPREDRCRIQRISPEVSSPLESDRAEIRQRRKRWLAQGFIGEAGEKARI